METPVDRGFGESWLVGSRAIETGTLASEEVHPLRLGLHFIFLLKYCWYLTKGVMEGAKVTSR